jgi:polysaccharide biosynthesis/export protein
LQCFKVSGFCDQTLKLDLRGIDMKLIWQAVAALMVIGGIALAQDAPAQPAANAASEKTASDQTTNAVSSSQTGPEYVIGPDDVLHIAVWKEADLSATLPVRPDGKISLPLLNDVQASGLTPQQLAGSVTEKLKSTLPTRASPWW